MRSTRQRVAVSTLGCKVNTFESELIAQRLVEGNYLRVSANEIADLYIINSCTVTAEADRQTRQLARKLKKQNPEAKVIITGCYAETHSQEVAEITGVNLVVGNAAKLDIPVMVTQGKVDYRPSDTAPIIKPTLDGLTALPESLLKGYENQTRAFIQIQQGCDRGCTFCIIHTARGPSQSFSVAAILKQFSEFVGQGYHEVVLCGVDLGAYGDDLTETQDLTDLIEAILALKLDCRLRISSIDPAHLSDRLVELIAREPRICPHIHLSMQSANTLILKRMKRRAVREVIYERVNYLRQCVPHIVLSADVLVGFPTETMEHFSDTLAAITDLQIAYPHVFPYSEREGTPAAKIKNQVEKGERKRRAKIIREAGKRVWHGLAVQQVGQTKQAILESQAKNNKHQMGLARCDDYYAVKIPMEGLSVGECIKLKVTHIKEGVLFGALEAL